MDTLRALLEASLEAMSTQELKELLNEQAQLWMLETGRAAGARKARKADLVRALADLVLQRLERDLA
jgi:hypothetical protein